jgi:hypothetical protein
MSFHECKGCGVVNSDPTNNYLSNIHSKGAHSCCPDREMIKISDSDDLNDIPEIKSNRFRTGAEDTIVLSADAFDKLTEMIDNPLPNPKLEELLNRESKFT